MVAARVHEWDATQLFHIHNEAKDGKFTCVGYASKAKRRCTKDIARDNRASAQLVLKGIPAVSTNGPRLRRQLAELAGLALCRANHQNQRDDVVSQWYDLVVTEVERRGGRVVEPPPPSQEDIREEMQRQRRKLAEIRREQEKRRKEEEYCEAEACRQEEERRQKEERSRRKKEASRGKDQPEGQRSSAGCSQDDIPLPEEELRSERDQLREEARHSSQNAQWAEDRRKEARRQSERESKEERARKVEEQQAEANRRQQEQQAEAEERQRKQQEETDRRRQQRQAQETAAQRERQLWSDIWTRYEQGWIHISASALDAYTEDLRDSLPWPVRNGRWQDVSERNVEEFFRHALNDVYKNKSAFRKLMQRQALRWHEGKLRHAFGCIKESSNVIVWATLVAQVVVRLMQKTGSRL